MADALDIKINDYVIAQIETRRTLYGPMRNSLIILENTTSLISLINAPFKVVQITADVGGKLSAYDNAWALVDFTTFLPYVANLIHPRYNITQRMLLASQNLYEYSHQLFVNIEPSKRMPFYSQNNYDNVQRSVTGFASEFGYLVGFDQISVDYPVLRYMNSTRFFSLFLGLILNMVIVVISMLSIVLIYSLLMINVETRQFEMGVLRMLGMKQIDLVQLIFMQALLYAIPGMSTYCAILTF